MPEKPVQESIEGQEFVENAGSPKYAPDAPFEQTKNETIDCLGKVGITPYMVQQANWNIHDQTQPMAPNPYNPEEMYNFTEYEQGAL